MALSDNPRAVPSLLVAGGGAALVIGSFLPWITATAALIGTITRSGMEGGDGWISLGLGAALVASGVSAYQRLERKGTEAIVLCVLATALIAFEWSDVQSRVDEMASDYSFGSIGIGLYLMAAGVVAAFAGAMQLRKRIGTKADHLPPPPLPPTVG